MGQELLSGPFRNISLTAEAFKKTENDLESLEVIINTFEKSFPTLSPIQSPAKHGKKTNLQSKKKDDRENSKGQKKNKLPQKSYPFWFAKTVEIYISLTRAYNCVQEDLKNTCNDYAKDVVTYFKSCKEAATRSPESLYKEIEAKLGSIQSSYAEKDTELTANIEDFKKRKESGLDKLKQVRFDAESALDGLASDKDTVFNITPTIKTQEALLRSATRRAHEKVRRAKEQQVAYDTMLAEGQRVRHRLERLSTLRNSFLAELRKRRDELARSAAVTAREGAELGLKEKPARSCAAIYAERDCHLRAKAALLLRTLKQKEKDLEKLKMEAKQLRSLSKVSREKYWTLYYSYQGRRTQISGRQAELIQRLNKKFEVLQCVLAFYYEKKKSMVSPYDKMLISHIENEKLVARELENLKSRYQQLCEQSDRAELEHGSLKKLLENTEERLEEVASNCLSVESGYKKQIQQDLRKIFGKYMHNADRAEPKCFKRIKKQSKEPMSRVNELQAAEEALAHARNGVELTRTGMMRLRRLVILIVIELSSVKEILVCAGLLHMSLVELPVIMPYEGHRLLMSPSVLLEMQLSYLQGMQADTASHYDILNKNKSQPVLITCAEPKELDPANSKGKPANKKKKEGPRKLAKISRRYMNQTLESSSADIEIFDVKKRTIKKY